MWRRLFQIFIFLVHRLHTGNISLILIMLFAVSGKL
ncbi:unnamed protein product, partial [Allacma fusca]